MHPLEPHPCGTACTRPRDPWSWSCFGLVVVNSAPLFSTVQMGAQAVRSSSAWVRAEVMLCQFMLTLLMLARPDCKT